MFNRHTTRRYIAKVTTKWLESAITPRGRAGAWGWMKDGKLTNTGALTIAIIRAELKRREAV